MSFQLVKRFNHPVASVPLPARMSKKGRKVCWSQHWTINKKTWVLLGSGLLAVTVVLPLDFSEALIVLLGRFKNTSCTYPSGAVDIT